MTIVGEVQEISSYFQWRIPDFLSLPQKGVVGYRSPDFECGNATWYLGVFPYSFSFPECISLYLYQLKSECSTHAVTFTFGIKDKDRKDYIPQKSVKRQFGGNGECLGGKLLERSKLIENRCEVAPEGVVTFSYCLSLDRSVEKETQPENEKRSIEECTKGKENTKEEEQELDRKDIFPILRGVDKTIHDFKGLLLNERDCDVTLKVQDREFRAHKLILGARSPVFCSMFQHNTVERNSGVVDIPDCDPDSFNDFLVYMYSGKVEKMNSSNVLNLYSVADKYSVDDLKKDCLECMLRELSVDTFGDVIALAVLHSESALIENATEFFTSNIKKIIMTVKWQLFLNENPTAANELYIRALDVLIRE